LNVRVVEDAGAALLVDTAVNFETGAVNVVLDAVAPGAK
jgi:hypothetical protein